jgi:hypothetical protein
MPDFLDRLIARGTQQPGGGMPAPGPGSGTPVAFALPRLPGPFERLAAEPPDPFLETVDEVRDVYAARPATPQAWPAFGNLAGTQSAITPPPLLRDATTPPAPRPAASGPGEQPSARPAPPQQSPLLPGAAPVHLVSDARAAAPDQAPAGALLDPGGRPPGDPPHGGAVRPSIPPRPPGLAVPASAVRAALPSAGEARTAQAQPPAPPPVTVRIGRIEVRNTSHDRRERQADKRAGRAGPKQTLAAYLAAASGGRNSSGVSTGGGR